MRRRRFPCSAGAGGMAGGRTIGVLMNDDGQYRLGGVPAGAAGTRAGQRGRNVQMDIRCGGDARSTLASWSHWRRRHPGDRAGMVPLLQATRIIPIVFNNVADPVGAASSRAWRGPGATPPASFSSSTV